MNEEINRKEEAFKKFKDFFKSDMRIKETLIKLAPNEIDDYNEESRIKYTDRLYKELISLEIEFTQMAKNLGDNPEIIQTIKSYFNKAKESFLIGKYEPGLIKKLYREQFSNMSSQLIEDVKGEFWGHKLDAGNLEGCIKKSGSINELLHVFHSYLTNNNTMMEELPVIAVKQNVIEQPIILYGEETELSRKLFEEFPLELDCDNTDIVSMQDKVLMMVRGRGHALTIDIDVTNSDEILVKYFVPKLCNRDMIEALPGVNRNGISENGATGLFQTSKEEITNSLFDFIKKVPTDFDSPQFKEFISEQQQTTIKDNEKSKENNTEIYQIEDSQNKTWNIVDKIKKGMSNLKRKLSSLFNKKNTLMLNAPAAEEKTVNDERKAFQAELREGIEQTTAVDMGKLSQNQIVTEITRDEE